VEIFDVARRPL